MKFSHILPILFITLFSASCSTDNDDDLIINELENLIKVQNLVNDTHTIEVYTKSGSFYTGYNAVSLRIVDNTSKSYIENASINWMPVMQMPTMQHSCPKSDVLKTTNKKTLYDGYIIYQMTNTDGSGWSLTINYTIDGITYVVTDTITVLQSKLQNVSSFQGSDNKRYVIAIIEPTKPIIGINNLVVGLYSMETMMSFPEVENYSLALDPRMPGMSNHSSPNNTDLTYSSTDSMYHADLSLTMTGYWVLNLKLVDAEYTVLKGEDVTETNTQSSLYLELEF
ncbi:hypothetical protein [Aestuariibaculum suncheonense]|uniref:YtkA-like domain-containing protein n=1 Tax=Aestuariibaculum suncheonense TaxID=1028745 RepID=A0A8J6UIJ8_9FLAO|nr:hypothetical protein [Aestuariibaculum suncheonense]MBD0836609.1 hypothetical protein [Aestuariibaculum suncheonense]